MHFADFCQFVFNRVCRDLKHPAPYNLFQTAKRFQGTGIIISQVKRNQEQFQALRLRNSRQFFFHTKAQRVQMFFQAGRSGGLSLRCSFLWHPFPIYPPTPPPPQPSHSPSPASSPPPCRLPAAPRAAAVVCVSAAARPHVPRPGGGGGGPGGAGWPALRRGRHRGGAQGGAPHPAPQPWVAGLGGYGDVWGGGEWRGPMVILFPMGGGG